jgi:hypothetical protein
VAGSSSYQISFKVSITFLKVFYFFQALCFGSLKPDKLEPIAYFKAINLFQNLIEMI